MEMNKQLQSKAPACPWMNEDRRVLCFVGEEERETDFTKNDFFDCYYLVKQLMSNWKTSIKFNNMNITHA